MSGQFMQEQSVQALSVGSAACSHALLPCCVNGFLKRQALASCCAEDGAPCDLVQRLLLLMCRTEATTLRAAAALVAQSRAEAAAEAAAEAVAKTEAEAADEAGTEAAAAAVAASEPAEDAEAQLAAAQQAVCAVVTNGLEVAASPQCKRRLALQCRPACM